MMYVEKCKRHDESLMHATVKLKSFSSIAYYLLKDTLINVYYAQCPHSHMLWVTINLYNVSNKSFHVQVNYY